MGWSCGYDKKWGRDVGYGVPALCDHPGCLRTIDRGLGHVCGSDIYGGEHGCGLFFCDIHLWFTPDDVSLRVQENEGTLLLLCDRCNDGRSPYSPTADVVEWKVHKLTDPSWEEWRIEHPLAVEELLAEVPEAMLRSPAMSEESEPWHDAALQVAYDFHALSNAKTPLAEARAMVALSNSMSDLESYLPGYEPDSGTMPWERGEDT